MAVGAIFALASLVAGPVLALLPSAVILFAIGWFTFLRAFSRGAAARAFGMVTTALPFLFGYIFAIWIMIGKLF